MADLPESLNSNALAEALTARTEARRAEALSLLPADSQAQLGQFFTPDRAAALMASFAAVPEAGVLRVLDPGAGPGSLSAAVAARMLVDSPARKLELVGVEVDENLIPTLRTTYKDIAVTLSGAGIEVQTRIIGGDLIALAEQDEALSGTFDLVIMNPPYRKLAASSAERRALSRLGVECPNLYAAFLAIGMRALVAGGQLVAITPRSFANGPYFGPFRQHFLKTMTLERVHTFESRSTVFSDSGVLQENVIAVASRDRPQGSVTLSASVGHADVMTEHTVAYEDVVQPGDTHRFIRIAAGARDLEVADTMDSLPVTLPLMGLRVSTGRVVDFRSRECLTDDRESGGYPLVYPANVRAGVVEWPRAIRKPQGFLPRREADEKLLVGGGYYVIVKRFSAKEERRRVVAAVWDIEVHGDGPVAFENHLNVIYGVLQPLDRDLAIGLSYWLNSTVVDTYFRMFSGHTQVNATDLRSLRFPAADDLRHLACGQPAALPAQTEIDQAVLPLATQELVPA